MPIDYSKFDAICDSDDDQEQAKTQNNGVDYDKLLKELRRKADGEDADPQDLYAAAGLGRSVVAKNVPPPPAPRLDVPFDGDALDPFSGLDDDFGFGEEDLSSTVLDFNALRAEAWRILCTQLVSSPRSDMVPRMLLLKAEVHVMANRYREALVTSLAVQLGTAANDPKAERQYGDWTASTMIIEMVCCYQLGDRSRATELRVQLQKMDLKMVSQHLKKRFEGTSEVLELVPQFLSLLQQQQERV